jgi:tetratricopeptide (TPR) repeat protein
MRILLQSFYTLLLTVSLCAAAHAQTAESIYDKYTDFNLAKLQGQSAKAFTIAAEVIAHADLLPPKSRTSFYNGLARLYEDADQPDKAQPLYEQVAKASPNYYVAHLALGHIYLKTANSYVPKMNAAGAAKDNAAYQKAFADYKAAANKALSHLEKAQACDPNDPNLKLIKSLYKSTKNEAALATLDARIAAMSKSCEDILNEN